MKWEKLMFLKNKLKNGNILILLGILSSSAYAEDNIPSLPPPDLVTKQEANNTNNSLNENIEQCSKITIGEDRLSCFDNMANTFIQDSNNKKNNLELNNNASAWQKKEGRYSYVIGTVAFHIDDDNNLFSKLTSSLILRCENRQYNTYVDFGTELFNPNSNVTVTIKNNGQNNLDTWKSSGSGQSVGIWSSQRALNFFTSLINMQTFKMEIQSKEGKNVSVSFDMNGASNLLKDLIDKCKQM